MTRTELIKAIKTKQSFLCVGLDTDIEKIPAHLHNLNDPILAFNKMIIDATKDFAVAYKINTAFYEAQGLEGWRRMNETLNYIPKDCFSIADAKRGDIGNTATQYSKTFFETYPYDSVTVAPYMGEDSVKPFLSFDGKWAIVLGLTSNKGSQDFQMIRNENGYLFEQVLRKVSSWGNPENTMFVIGATQGEQLKHIRNLLPDHFFLVPGVGAQGGDVDTVCQAAATEEGGLLINVSRGIIYADNGVDFDQHAGVAAQRFQNQMAKYL